ncbi:MAG: HDOD domain-containing protein [Nitrospiraceae bacterium]|nr:HDOD domain-containing protein [Nitrospiraceae bacterium]
MKRKILFVDDESMVLQGIKRMLRGMRKKWDMYFVESGEDALKILKKDHFDVVVSDMCMPGMNGAQLLTEVMERFPDVVRIVLSGYSDQKLALKSAKIAHQYLSKPCEAETLKNTVARACALRDLLADKELERMVSEIGSLPSLPSLYQEIMAEVQSGDASIKKIATIISKDIAMTAKILQMVNSAFFALPRHIERIDQAVNLLGLETIKALVLSTQIFSQFQTKDIPRSFIEKLWEHSMRVGCFARAIAREEELPVETIDESFLAGLLHDVGKLILCTGSPKKYREIVKGSKEPDNSFTSLEDEILGTTHGVVGAYLMGLWGFADNVIEAIAFHHKPVVCPAKIMGPLTIVHVADALEHNSSPEGINIDAAKLDTDFLRQVGCLERLNRWGKVCEKTIQ